ncbi:MAG: hypothetical protein J2P16_00060 [Mycobacterium sp.]|nr:hypothetical protein [Mycobacterium sp.]
MGLATFSLDLTPAFTGSKVVVNGQPLPDTVRALAVRAGAGDVTTLTVELIGDATLTGEGIVEVSHADDLRDAAAIVRSIDPDQLAAEAQGQADMGSSFTKVVLELVADLLESGQ